jgi:integrase
MFRLSEPVLELTFADSLPTIGDMKRKQRSKPEVVKVGNVMVRIYKRCREVSSTIYTSYYVEDHTSGKRRWRVFADHAEARREAEKLAGQVSSGQATAAEMTNAEAASYGRAVELLRPSGIALELAAAHFAKAVEILGSDEVTEAAKFYKLHRLGQVTRKTVAQVAKELREKKEKGTQKGKPASARYLGDLRARLNKFVESFGGDISTITGADVQGWLDKFTGQTARNYRTVLSTLFNFAEKRKYIAKGMNPMAEVEQIAAVEGDVEIYTPDEISAILKAAPADFLPLVALGAFGGLRAAEAGRLTFEKIDLAGGFIHIDKDIAKKKSRRLVPIQPNLAKWLAPYANKSGKVWKGNENELRDIRAEAVKAAGIPWRPNALRHSFCSYRLADTDDINKVAIEAGNSPDMIHKHYRELVKPTAAKAWFAVAPETPENVIHVGKENRQ